MQTVYVLAWPTRLWPSDAKSPIPGLLASHRCNLYPQPVVEPAPHATDTPSPEPLRATLVDGTAASARTASDAASSFFVFDIRVTSLRFEPLRTRLRAFGGSLTASYCDANERLMRFSSWRPR